MKSYPSITTLIQMGLPIYAFDKIDGSNIRAEWSKKRGLYKFGARKRLLGEDQPILTKAQGLILEQEDIIAKICEKNKWQSITLFYEFAGIKSSFGNHIEEDDHKVWLIDANPYKRGILPPREFINQFDGIQQSSLLYRGNCNNALLDSVNNGTLEGMGSEGVVCKTKGKGNTIIMFKIKREDWYHRLRQRCGNNEKLYDMLK
jgi:hypothetical protein